MPADLQTFSSRCSLDNMLRLCRNSLHALGVIRILKGEEEDYPLPPQEQRLILETLQESGVKQDLKFDSYEELINWYD